MAVHEVAAGFYQDRLAGSWVPGYLSGRGFDGEVLERWQVGYAPVERDALLSYLRAAGFSVPVVQAAGLAWQTSRGGLVDTFRDRFMLPIRSPHGAVIAFIGRVGPDAGGGAPKYLNSPSTVLYGKGDVLFGLYEAQQALAAHAVPVIVEGPLDVLAVSAAGGSRFAPVAPCGTALTGRQVAALGGCCELAAADVLVGFDADRAGRHAALGAYRLLSPRSRRVCRLVLPAGHDPAQVLRDGGASALGSVLADCRLPLADLVVDAEIAQWARWLSFAEGQVGAMRRAALVIAGMPPADVGRQVCRVAEQLSVSHELVTQALTNAVARRYSPAGGRSRLPASARSPRPGVGSACQQEFPLGSREAVPAAEPNDVGRRRRAAPGDRQLQRRRVST